MSDLPDGAAASPSPVVVAIVPAKDREDSVAATVAALAAIDRVDRVLVVDDGSDDDTAGAAAAAGAEVLRLPRNRGKGAAVLAGAKATPDADYYLLIDADLASTASAADLLLDPVLNGDADLTVGVLPSAGSKGGFGTIRTMSARGIRRASGLEVEAPLSGQRVVRADLLRGLRDAGRFGLEVAMTIDVARAGGRVLEVPVPMDHRHTGRSLSGFMHRGGQGLDIVRSLWPRVTTARQRIGILVLGTLMLSIFAVLNGARSAPDSVAGGAPAKKVLIFGFNPYSFDALDKGSTPNLDALIERGALGATSVRTVTASSNAAEGFLAIGGAARLSAPGDAATFLPVDDRWGDEDIGEYVESLTGVAPTGDLATTGIGQLNAFNSGPAADGYPGFLADTLAKQGLASTFVGTNDSINPRTGIRSISRPAALATMRSDGSTDGVVDGLTVQDDAMPYGMRIDPEAVATATLDELDSSALVVVDPGDLDRANRLRRSIGGEEGDAAWQGAVARTDEALGLILDKVDDDTLVIVLSLAPNRRSYLLPTVVAGPGVPAGTLQSSSTKREGLVAVTDVAPTVLQALGIAKPSDVPGNPFRYSAGKVDRHHLEQLDRDTVVRERTYGEQGRYFIRLHLVVYLLALLALIPGFTNPRLRNVSRHLCLGLASYPMMSFLVRLIPDISTWYWAQIRVAIVLAAIAALLFATRRRHPLAPLSWLAGATTAVVILDTWIGTPMQMSSWLGSSMHNAGRFYGIPNTTFAVVAAASIIWACLHVQNSDRKGEATVAAGCVLFLVLISAGLPMLGADVGTLMTLTPVYALVIVALIGRKIRLRTLVMAGLAMVAVVVAAAAADLARPERSRTHLGQFAQRVLDNGPSAITDSFSRKQSANFRLLGVSMWSDLLPIVIAFVIVALALDHNWRRAFPKGSALRVAFWGVIGAALFGFATNDSGPIVLALFAAYLAPLVAFAAMDRVDEPTLTPATEPAEPAEPAERSRSSSPPPEAADDAGSTQRPAAHETSAVES